MDSPSINNTCLGAPTEEDNITVYSSTPPQQLPNDDDLTFYIYLYKITTPALFALIMLTGLVGNSLVVCVTLTQHRMRTTVNLFLLNLAFSDLTFLVVCVPFMAYHFYAENWVIGEATCKLHQYILYVTVYVTVYTLVSISVMRFLHVVRANRDVCTRRFVIGVVVAVWATMLTANVPILFITRVKKISAGYADAYHYCGMDSPEVNGRRVLISFFVLAYIAPLSTIATMYVLILRYLRRKQNRSSLRHQRRKSSAAVTVRRNSYATRISIAIVVVFGACWLPLHALLLNSYYGFQPSSRAYEVFRVLCHVLAYSNSCMNPFIYHYVSTDFRQGLRSLASSICRRTGRFGRRARTTTGVLWEQETVLRRYSMKEIGSREWTARGTSD